MTTPTLGLAVSGGPDSLALLLIASAREPVRVATVDHGLRPGSRAEAVLVASICADRGVPHDILSLDLPAGTGQAEAREARYAALGQWCVEHGLTRLATAHHIDDQAETLLMRLARGAGVAGLVGVRACRSLCDKVVLERPLLDRRKSELEAIVAAAGLTPVRDPSNADARYDRTAIRALLARTPELDPARLARSAANLASAEEALAWSAEQLAAERIVGNTLDPHGLPAELLRRLVLRFFPGQRPRGADLDRLLRALKEEQVATLAGVKVTGGPLWKFEAAPPHRR